MKGFRFEPVKWMTWLLGMLIALSGVQMFMAILPARVQAGILMAIAVLTAILGVMARNRVTALAAPRDNIGRALVPVSATYPRGGASATQDIRADQDRAPRYNT